MRADHCVWRACCCALVLLLGATLSAPGARAQASSNEPLSPVGLMTPAGFKTASGCVSDTTTTVKRLVLGMATDQNLSAPARAMATDLATRIAVFIDRPARISIDKLRGPGDWRDAAGTYHSEGLLSVGQLVFDVDAAGHVTRATLDPGTGSPEVDRAILAGVALADSSRALAAEAGSAQRHARLWLLTAAKAQPSWATPLFELAGRVPAESTPATVVHQETPSYPVALRVKHVEGDVVVAFDVDEQGQVPAASVHVISADDSAFVAPAIASIRAAKFLPAREGGCAVSSTMRQRLRFRPPGGGPAK
jgi:TonB family protein